MAFYVIRVAPRQEENFLKRSARLLGSGVSLVFPRRKMEHLKGGKRVWAEVALFPGYIFLNADQLDPELYGQIRAVPGFTRFLKQGNEISEVRGKDLEVLSHFLRFGEITPTSHVVFDGDQRIRVLSGPMQGLEGQIIHVDRRKRRAKIRLDFDHGTFTITLGFELMEPSSKAAS